MFLAPEVMLSLASRKQCILKIKTLPKFVKCNKPSKAAVLVPICVVNNEICLLYTIRSLNLSRHSGQVSFPGGKVDTGENVFETVLRETEEEIGVLRNQIDIWTEMIRIHGIDTSMLVTPIIGEIKNINLNSLKKNDNEVAEIFTVPIRELCDKKNHGSCVYSNITTPIFVYGKHKIWGITGFITHFFLRCFLPSDVYKVDFKRKLYELDELVTAKV